MGIKEYLNGKIQKVFTVYEDSSEEKYKLSDVFWATNMIMDNRSGSKEMAVNTPYILNKDVTKGKNIETGVIFEFHKDNYSCCNPLNHALCNNAGLDYDKGGCDVMNSVELIDKAITILGTKATYTKIIYDFGRHLSKTKQDYNGRLKMYILKDFCDNNKYSQSELMELAGLLKNTRNARITKRLKQERKDAEYERDVRDFW